MADMKIKYNNPLNVVGWIFWMIGLVMVLLSILGILGLSNNSSTLLAFLLSGSSLLYGCVFVIAGALSIIAGKMK